MEKQCLVNSTILDCVQQHNQNQDLYKFVLQPQRNSLCFNNNYDDTIVTQQIKEKINFLKNIGFRFDNTLDLLGSKLGIESNTLVLLDSTPKFESYTFNIRTTKYSWYLDYSGTYDLLNNSLLNHSLINDPTLKYLSINGIILKSDYMIEYIKNNKILYNPHSFRQSDDSIKYKIYDILVHNILNKHIYFIGGEMIFMNMLLSPTNFIMYTDFESIYNDALRNFPKNKDNIYLINYDIDKLQNINMLDNFDDYILIANTSKSGLGENLVKNIIDIGLKNVVIISCNKKSFNRDYKILNNKYKINKTFEITTNYTVSIYFLSLL